MYVQQLFLDELGWCDGPIERSLLLGVDEPGLIAGLLGCHRGRRSGSDAQCCRLLARACLVLAMAGAKMFSW